MYFDYIKNIEWYELPKDEKINICNFYFTNWLIHQDKSTPPLNNKKFIIKGYEFFYFNVECLCDIILNNKEDYPLTAIKTSDFQTLIEREILSYLNYYTIEEFTDRYHLEGDIEALKMISKGDSLSLFNRLVHRTDYLEWLQIVPEVGLWVLTKD